MIPIVTALLPALGTLIERLIPDKAEAERARLDMEAALVNATNQAAMAQVEVNKIEAGHATVFVAGWRPFIGWVCGVALALYYIPMFIIGMALWIWACLEAGHLVPRPELGIAEIIGLVMAMLGLGGLRTLEKLNGVARQ